MTHTWRYISAWSSVLSCLLSAPASCRTIAMKTAPLIVVAEIQGRAFTTSQER